MAGTMDKIKAKVDNVLHKDKSHNDPTTSTSHTGTNVTGNHGTTGTHGTHGNDPTGPHSSHMSNKADPRVDSDRYGAAGNTSGAGGVGAGQYGSSTHTGTHGTTGTHATPGGLGQNTATTHGDPSGPHSSKMANKLDPTVDTKSYGTADPTTGHYGSSNTHGTTGGLTGGSHNTHGTTGGLTGSGHNTHGTTGGLTGGSHGTHAASGYSDPSGPHSSYTANQLDPRVDSDRYGAAGNTAGAGGYGAGQYGSNTSSGLTGSHDTHTGTHTGTTGSGLTGSHGTHSGTTGSGLTGSHGTHSGTTGSGLGSSHGHTGTVGSGNSNTTAGPHNSDMMNKLDPRVDSDLNGSKTMGGNQTYR